MAVRGTEMAQRLDATHGPIRIVATDGSSTVAPVEVERERKRERDHWGSHTPRKKRYRPQNKAAVSEREGERDRLEDFLEALEIEAVPDRGKQDTVGGEKEDVNRCIGNDREAKIEAVVEREGTATANGQYSRGVTESTVFAIM